MATPPSCTYSNQSGVFLETYGSELQWAAPPPQALTQLDVALRLPYIRGVSHYQNWSTLEIAPGVFNWTIPDAVFALAAKHDKHVILGLQMGVAAPAWLLTDPQVPTVDFVHANRPWAALSTVQRWVDGLLVSRLARAWDNPVYAARVEAAVRALAARYAGRKELVFVNVAGPSASGGVEANFNMQYPLSRRVNPAFDAQLNYTEAKFVQVWQQRIDLYLALFAQVGMATHDQPGQQGLVGGRVITYTDAQRMATARAVRDYLVAEHPRRKAGRPAVVRCCGGSSNPAIWGPPGSRQPPPSTYALLMWEVRQQARIGFEEATCQAIRNATAAQMGAMLATDRAYNGQFLEIKRPDIINNTDQPELLYAAQLQAAAAAMLPGGALPWPCTFPPGGSGGASSQG